MVRRGPIPLPGLPLRAVYLHRYDAAAIRYVSPASHRLDRRFEEENAKPSAAIWERGEKGEILGDIGGIFVGGGLGFSAEFLLR